MVLTWSKIAAMIGVSRIKLHRRIRELGLEEETRYSEIDDQELDVFVRTILALLNNSSEVMIRGARPNSLIRLCNVIRDTPIIAANFDHVKPRSLSPLI